MFLGVVLVVLEVVKKDLFYGVGVSLFIDLPFFGHTPASVKVARGTPDDPGFSALTPPRSGPNLAKMCPRSRALICQKMVPNGRNLALILQFVVRPSR